MFRFVQRVRATLFLIGHKALEIPAKVALGRRGCIALFDGRPDYAYPPDWADLWFLYRTVRELKPATVLEFGSGCSTIIISRALADNDAEGRAGHLYSLDTKPEPGGTDWGQVTLESMPDELMPYCTLKVTDVGLTDFNGEPAWRYMGVPDVKPDMIYLDGPDFVNSPYKVAADVLDLEPAFKPGLRLIVDGRLKNCAFLEAHFKKSYRKSHHTLLHNTVYDLAGN